ncbi:MAG: MMPL family transporter [Actinomycetes bacterium]
MLERWTRLILRHRIVVIGLWLILALLGAFAGTRLNGHLTTSLAVPGSDSAKADEILTNHFKDNIEGSFTVLYKFKNATKAEIAVMKGQVASAAKVIPGARITQEKALGGVLFASVGTTFKLTDAAAYTVRLRESLHAVGLTQALVTGPPAINHDVTPVLALDLQLGQIVALGLALLLLLLMLGTSLVVFVPLIFAGASISLALGIVYLLAQKFLMVLYIPNIIELIGLGLSIDYALLIVHRFRRELIDQPEIEIEAAIIRTMKTAGRTVILSGFSVSVGLATLLLVPIPFVRSLGAAGLVVPIVAMATAICLLPAILSVLGHKGVTPKGFQGLMGRKDLMTGIFARVSRIVIKRPISIFIFSLTALAIAAASVLWLQVTPSSLTAIPANLESSRALAMITDQAGLGIITPNQIVVDLGASGMASDPAVVAARTQLTSAISKNPEAFVVAAGAKTPYVDSTGRYLRMFIIGHHDFGSKIEQQFVKELRNTYIPKSTFPSGTKIYLGGAPAQGVDLLDRILHSFPKTVALVLFIAYLVLLRAFRSLILPLKAILMDLISIAVAYASLVVVFRFGAGTKILGTYHLPQIEAWIILFLFAVLFGMSMDYEVFIVSRMREAWDRGESNEDSIVEGLAHTGGVVTAAAIILVGALSGLVYGHFAGLQQLGVGLAFGVLVDATLIRGLLLPSAMVLLGRWNWWLPAPLATLLKTKASPLREKEARL